MLRALIKSREMLARWGVDSDDMCMVLFAMLEEGLAYAEALRAYSEYRCRSCTAIERDMEAACVRKGCWCGARYILEKCYEEAIR